MAQFSIECSIAAQEFAPGCSRTVGIARTKHLAKIASQAAKPDEPTFVVAHSG
jgi:nucleotidyltransferase/DNA polymerase involved in DNA repair